VVDKESLAFARLYGFDVPARRTSRRRPDDFSAMRGILVALPLGIAAWTMIGVLLAQIAPH
jgi:hypothetical protein